MLSNLKKKIKLFAVTRPLFVFLVYPILKILLHSVVSTFLHVFLILSTIEIELPLSVEADITWSCSFQLKVEVRTSHVDEM